MAGEVVAIDAAGEQQLGDDVVLQPRRATRQLHTAAAPAPGFARQRTLDAEDCGAGGHGAGLDQRPAAGKRGAGEVDSSASAPALDKASVSDASRRRGLDPGRLSRHTRIGELGTFISTAQDIDAGKVGSAASLLFGPGERPRADAIAALAREQAGFSVSLDPAEGQAGEGNGHPGRWLELLANGLTFDLVGLAPGAAAPAIPRGHSFGLPMNIETWACEAITLQPGPHLESGAALLPVVRSLAWLAARLAGLPGVQAVAWHPARCWSPPEQFRNTVLRWIEGGVFPAFCLAALSPMPDGGLQSEGLALFTGQELRLEPELAEDRVTAGKIGLRLLDWLVEHGPLTDPNQLIAPDESPLRLEPSANGRFVRVWRG
jgi:hypothetical protein